MIIIKYFILQSNEGMPLGSSKSSLFAGSTFNCDKEHDAKDDKTTKQDKEEQKKKLPIINPLVRLPSWPSNKINKKSYSINNFFLFNKII